MLKSFDKYPFPRETDLAAIVEHVPPNQLDAQLHEEGVFLIAKKEHRATLLSRFAFQESWYAASVATTARNTVGVQIMAVELPTTDQNAVLASLESRRAKREPFKTSKHRPEIVKVGGSGGDHGFPVWVEYVQVRALRTEFFRRERHEFVFYVGLAPTKRVELLAIVDTSADGAVARDVFEGVKKDLMLGGPGMGLDGLDAKARTDVFQGIFDLAEAGKWRPREVRSLKVRRYTSDGKAEEEEIDETVTTRLTSAEFKGRRIDEDDYVKKLIALGYFFRSAEIIAFNPNLSASARDVIVTLNFSENPHILLVSARESGMDGTSLAVDAVSDDELVSVAEYFWRQTHRLLALEHEKLAGAGKPAGKAAAAAVTS